MFAALLRQGASSVRVPAWGSRLARAGTAAAPLSTKAGGGSGNKDSGRERGGAKGRGRGRQTRSQGQQGNRSMADNFQWAKSVTKRQHYIRPDANGWYQPQQQVVDAFKEHMQSAAKFLYNEHQRLLDEGVIEPGSREDKEIQEIMHEQANDMTPPFPIEFHADAVERPMTAADVTQYQMDTINKPLWMWSPKPLEEIFQPGVLRTRTVYTKRVSNMTRGGRRPRMSVLVLAGKGNGGAGFAVAKAQDVLTAEKQAIKRASAKMVLIPRLNDRTIFHPIQTKYKKTKIYMRPAKQGAGVKAHALVAMICELAGITDLTCDIFGSKNPLNIVRATFKALESQVDPLEEAIAEGKALLQIDNPGMPPKVLYVPPGPISTLTNLTKKEKKDALLNWVTAFPNAASINALSQGKQLFDGAVQAGILAHTKKDLALVMRLQDEKASLSGDESKEAEKAMAKAAAQLEEISSRVPTTVDALVAESDQLASATGSTADAAVLAWFADRPTTIVDAVEMQALLKGTFLDDAFWPGGVATARDMHNSSSKQSATA